MPGLQTRTHPLYLPADDGYTWMGAAQRRGFEPRPSWGHDGWDLGDWPFIIVGHYKNTIVSYREHDIYVEGPDDTDTLNRVALWRWLFDASRYMGDDTLADFVAPYSEHLHITPFEMAERHATWMAERPGGHDFRPVTDDRVLCFAAGHVHQLAEHNQGLDWDTVVRLAPSRFTGEPRWHQ